MNFTDTASTPVTNVMGLLNLRKLINSSQFFSQAQKFFWDVETFVPYVKQWQDHYHYKWKQTNIISQKVISH